MSATLAPHRQTLEVAACDVVPGDRIVQDGFIGMTVDYVDPHPFRAGFVVVSYSLAPGDRIVQDGFIDMTVDYVDPHPFRAGFVVVSYSPVAGIYGERAFVAAQPVVVQRMMEGAH